MPSGSITLGTARELRSGAKSPQQISVGIDSPIAKKRPVAPRFLDQPQVAFGDEYLLGRAGARDHFAEGVDHE